MANEQVHIIELLQKYSQGQATAGDMETLFALLRGGEYDEAVVSYIETHLSTFEPVLAADIEFWKDRLQNGAQAITGIASQAAPAPVVEMPEAEQEHRRVPFLRRFGWIAAAAILILVAGAYLWMNHEGKKDPVINQASSATILPGKNGAILTLADGSKVVLDSLGNGVIAVQNGTQVVLQEGKLAYDAQATTNGEAAYNTIHTPNGRMFQMTLPDGTKVWLNAGSSLRYPTAFTGKERLVAVTGEAYFEVSHNAQLPFRVNVNDHATVEVLGTHFNVNAYANEAAIHTTLLQGSVRISQTGHPATLVLKPGQQAAIAQAVQRGSQNGIQLINQADIDKTMAWKNGLFNFEGATLGEVMRQLERWYDIEVAYEKGIPHMEFEGKMTKDVPLKEVLKFLEKSEIHFRTEGRKLIVLP